jgi:hypothetical protein
MNPLIQLKQTTSVFLAAFGLACLALSSAVQAVSPPPDGGYANENTAEGTGALQNLTTGIHNNAFGNVTLFADTTGSYNTATGSHALQVNTASDNTATGFQSLVRNTIGRDNVANGWRALFNNLDGDNNVAVGKNAGITFVHASDSIAIGVTGAGPYADSSFTCFIGSIHNEPVSDPGSAQAVYVDQFNVLGYFPSSRRFKHDIKPMNKASEAILALQPVTFKYNSDKKGTPEYGLIAEDVAEVNPDLVLRDKKGEIETVRYEQINAMLLNEFLKEHRAFLKEQRKVEVQEKTIAELKSGMTALAVTVKEQASQIQKVSAQIEASKPGPQVVNNP